MSAPASPQRLARCFALAAVLAAGQLLPAPAHAAYRLQAPEMIPLPANTVGDLAVGDVDGDGVPEIATFGADRRVRVLKRIDGRWTEVFASIWGAAVTNPANQVPTVRFTREPAIAPGPAYEDGQFLFNAQAPGVIIVAIRQYTTGEWNEELLFGPLPFIPLNGAFSPPVPLPAEGNASPEWRVIVPGNVLFDPPMRVYLPAFGESAPYPYLPYDADGQGYCEQSGALARDAVSGDFDGDGNHEIAVVRTNKLLVTGTLSANGGSGCWPYNQVVIGTSAGHAQAIAARFDGDGTTDIVVRDADGLLRVLYGTAGANNPYQFTDSALVSTAPGPAASTDLAFGDFDADGDMDLVQTFSTPPGYEVYLNDGQRNFTASFTPLDPTGGAVSAVAIGDTDQDTRVDLALSQATAYPPRILILPGLGNGTFGLPAGTPLIDLEPSAVVTADLDEDLALDVIIGGHDTNIGNGYQAVQVFLNQGGGTFDPPTAVEGFSLNTYAGVRHMVAFRPDTFSPLGLALFQLGGEFEASGVGDGTLLPLYLRYSTFTGSLSGLDRADMDGDGQVEQIRLEILQTGDSYLTIDGSAFTGFSITGAHSGVRAVDWDGDGLLDLVMLDHDQNQVVVRLMDAGWTFPTVLAYPLDVQAQDSYSNRGVAFAVLPHAGAGTHRALAVRGVIDSTQQVQFQVIRNEGQTIGEVYVTAPGVAAEASLGIAAGDVDADGIPDIVVAEQSGWSLESFVTVFRGRPSPPDTFETGPVFVFPGSVLNGLAIGDITGDGRDDLVTVLADEWTIAAPTARTGRPRLLAGAGEFVVVPAVLDTSVTTAVEPIAPRPPSSTLALALSPSPARGDRATLSFALPARERVTADLYDLGGRRIRRLLDEDRGAGPHAEDIALSDGAGRPLAAGVYFLGLRAGKAAASRRMVVVR